MSATIYEVAKKSGFSISTVSRVLNGIPLHSETTRMRVLQAISELNFQPHTMAQGLARRRNKTFTNVAPLDHASSLQQSSVLQPESVE
ncbi:LacI family DNA-binding transcriptional regulator [candidate division KSB1 bacterium]|nr:LacI family DNA-binding transcriptional regulator [candidate division KSB1 bacterium]